MMSRSFDFTVFYRHPLHMPEGGRYTVNRTSARIAGREAADMLPDDLCETEEPSKEDGEDARWEYSRDIERIRDDLEIKVYAGIHESQPAGEPDYEYR